MIRYIHYGSSMFAPLLFSPVRNRIVDMGGLVVRHTIDQSESNLLGQMCYWPKPHGGLWASRANDAHGWAAWCRDNHFNTDELSQNFTFTLKPGSRVVNIVSLDDIDGLPLQRPWQPKDRSWMEKLGPGAIPTPEQLETLYMPNPVFLDFEELVRQGVDAVEIADWAAVSEAFPLWDCNCLLVMNADAVV